MKTLTFDDVALVPGFNNVESRNDPVLTSWITRERPVSLPVVPSNMESVIGEDLIPIILGAGGCPIIHRFFKDQSDLLSILNRWGNTVILSWGVNNIPELIKFLGELPAIPDVCLDVAHGHSEAMKRAIGEIKSSYPDLEIIAGNVATGRGTHDLILWGADAVKVGIGPGAACTTRLKTGFGVPQFSALLDCSEVGRDFKIPIIADGGCRGPADIVKAFAAGASTVMLGKMFAACEESAAEKAYMGEGGMIYNGSQTEHSGKKRVARYRGQASKSFQEDFFGELKEGTVAEGEAMWTPVTGTTSELIEEIKGSLRSALTYCGAKNLREFRKKVKWVEVSPSYQQESGTRV